VAGRQVTHAMWICWEERGNSYSGQNEVGWCEIALHYSEIKTLELFTSEFISRIFHLIFLDCS
jgi:hypothetical protein